MKRRYNDFNRGEENHAAIGISSEEAATLSKVLNIYLSDLRMEIANTDSMDYREGLKKEEMFLVDFIGRLAGTP